MISPLKSNQSFRKNAFPKQRPLSYTKESERRMTHDLHNKIILITGASRGIGRAVALVAAKAGADLIITGRTIGALEELDDEIKALFGY